jgi:hypothetical protein
MSGYRIYARNRRGCLILLVMRGLDPRIHVEPTRKMSLSVVWRFGKRLVDRRVEPDVKSTRVQ